MVCACLDDLLNDVAHIKNYIFKMKKVSNSFLLFLSFFFIIIIHVII